MEGRRLSQLDRVIINFDDALRTVFGQPRTTERASPASGIAEGALSEKERRLSGCLMRVNHAGEVAAQALYQGQALTARLTEIRKAMENAAREENEHLVWCQQRVQELGAHTSYLGPFWYGGSFVIGALAGMAGDKWSLGFVAETEHQVVKHIERHLDRISAQDAPSRAILEQMKEDEARHATVALEAGGVELPSSIKALMGAASKVMTRTAYWI
ncbi:2-polyprenyl-3-methyl-6-methoxy-1,4-benzoquinone monooxygenase [Nitrosococcus oceani]|uniref:3-demethoxyubiquinol 3-hydroxylase n=2 Tax=Nitrosococcus oceani TaxID=1229 RepID=COQ7_NITOC|nr:2-polyprenyl-3-methyl-6-methoxy-1,4-benzoquinone monooxygenase [Nitrosococcus oceani]Q3JCJ6.1 RecName: Full=3-demethoxyubiquinol 3-hydroxylase; Short=DMQ hydroxylase; AltName: Full=2-nonaprenyl-3-methyl-6-methoxy-1,4-benzoquinol hydroxylase [Nitrosococcus oceani ATCC 19707]ABA57450.1 putative ubiquinone biosynthesis protein [Nitrosococcus oceani ATCC 19707]KFI20143.1 2-octaprenyl-3-methyl-6-methoxy-1,4-benzoquinol hydroxylase [Nitrosococcus oceani C-27]KFI23311.1 2-octaprenyl-3-methyl-6-meth